MTLFTSTFVVITAASGGVVATGDLSRLDALLYAEADRIRELRRHAMVARLRAESLVPTCQAEPTGSPALDHAPAQAARVGGPARVRRSARKRARYAWKGRDTFA